MVRNCSLVIALSLVGTGCGQLEPGSQVLVAVDPGAVNLEGASLHLRIADTAGNLVVDRCDPVSLSGCMEVGVDGPCIPLAAADSGPGRTYSIDAVVTFPGVNFNVVSASGGYIEGEQRQVVVPISDSCRDWLCFPGDICVNGACTSDCFPSEPLGGGEQRADCSPDPPRVPRFCDSYADAIACADFEPYVDRWTPVGDARRMTQCNSVRDGLSTLRATSDGTVTRQGFTKAIEPVVDGDEIFVRFEVNIVRAEGTVLEMFSIAPASAPGRLFINYNGFNGATSYGVPRLGAQAGLPGTLTEGQWHCLEYRFLASQAGEVEFFLDGTSMGVAALDARPEDGAPLEKVIVGISSLFEPGATEIHMDNLVISNERVGCP